MKTNSQTVASLLAVASICSAQHVTVPDTCTGNFTAGSDEVLYTVPYTYDEVMSIIGSYQNLTWSGSPERSVTLNGTDNQVGTARTYDLAGAHVIETILTYSRPPAPGPYDEVHNTALLSVGPIEVYIPYDGTTVTSYCDGKASQFNFTAHFCANNASAAAATLHMLHLGDAVTVGTFLGGKNFTSCEALGSSGSAPPAASGTAAEPSSSATSSPATYTGAGSLASFNLAAVMAGILAMSL